MSKYNYISISETGSLIDKEITAAKGADVKLTEFTKFFTTKDVNDLTNELIKRKERALKCTILSVLVSPCNNAVEGIAAGNFSDVDKKLKPEEIKLQKENTQKMIHLVIPDETVFKGAEAEYLFKLRKKLLKNPVNYLLGLTKIMNNGELNLPSRTFEGLEIIALPENRNDLQNHPGSVDHERLVAAFYYNTEGHYICREGIFEKLPGHTAILCEDLD